MARRIIKYNKVWFKNWEQLPESTNIPITEYMKTTLKYYPKTPRCLKPIFLQIDKIPYLDQGNEGEVKGLFKKITQRYKPIFCKHLEFFCPSDYLRKIRLILNLNSLQTISVEASLIRPFSKEFKMLIKKIMIQNKNLKAIRLTGYFIPSSIIICLRYSKGLRCLELTDITDPYSHDYRFILASKPKLEALAITEYVVSDKFKEAPEHGFAKLLDEILLFPFIKQFRFDGQVPDEFDVSTIPFSSLKKKGICYDIRVFQGTRTATFTEENTPSLKELNMLGLNFKQRWYIDDMEWGVYQEESLKAQATCKNRFFLTSFSVQSIDITDLFHSCQNITTLDLIMPSSNTDIDFSGLQFLCNLQNLFVHIDNISKDDESLFKNLTICANRYKRIQALHLYLLRDVMLDDHADTLSDFFDACADTVSKATLQISLNSESLLTLERFYKSLAKLTQLKALSLYWKNMVFQTFDDETLVYHVSQVGKILEHHSLIEEFRLLVPIQSCTDLNIGFKKCKNLKKICLDFEGSNKAIENCLEVNSMKYLALNIRKKLDPTDWEMILKKLCKLKSLEVVKMEISLQEYKGDLRQDLSRVMLKSENIKLITIENTDNLEDNILVFTRDGYWERLDEFFSDYNFGKKFTHCYEVHKF